MRGGQGGHRWREVAQRNLFIPPRMSESVNTTETLVLQSCSAVGLWEEEKKKGTFQIN